MGSGATAQLAAFVAECPAEAVTDKARQEVKRAVLDVLGTALAGANEEVGALARRFVESENASGPAGVLGSGLRTSSALAAWANGTLAHALDFDDVGLGVGHPSVVVVPVALAVAEETNASGSDFVGAIALGYEAASRVGTAAGWTPYRRGYHGTSIYGVFGAAAATGRLLRLTPAELRNAFGIAASQAGGLRANFGTMTKPLHAGVTCQTGVVASRLAKMGWTANPDILESAVGFGPVIAGRSLDESSGITSDLGGTLAIERGVDIKKFPCCYLNHAALDAFLGVMKEHGLSGRDVAQIQVDGSWMLNEVLLYPTPATGLQGKFSLQYNLAAALLDGGVTRATFADARAADPELRATLPRVIVNAHEEWPRPLFSVRLTVSTVRGETIIREQDSIKGQATDPLSWDELAVKFRDNAASVLGAEAIERAIDAVADLDRLESVKPLVDLLVGQRPAEGVR